MFEKKKPKKPQYDINWYSDKYQSALVTRDRLLLVTFLAIIAMGAMTFAMFHFVPLKTVKPFVIQVDQNTGLTEVVESQAFEDYSANEEIIKYFAMQYIYARESYDYELWLGDYNKVTVMSSPEIWKIYRMQVNASEQSSPLNKYGTTRERKVKLKSFSFIEKTSTQTRVQAKLEVIETTLNRGISRGLIEVTLSCRFNPNKLLTDAQRLINPLGFEVLWYKVAEYKEN